MQISFGVHHLFKFIFYTSSKMDKQKKLLKLLIKTFSPKEET